MFDRKQIEANAQFCLGRYGDTAYKTVKKAYVMPLIVMFFFALMLMFAVFAAASSAHFTQAGHKGLWFWLIAAGALYLAENTLDILIFSPKRQGLVYFFLRSREDVAKPEYVRYAYDRCFGKTIGMRALTDILMFPLCLAAMVPFFGSIALNAVSGNVLFILLPFAMWAVGVFASSAAMAVYSMTPWLLAENADMSVRRAVRLSREMTRGYRCKIAVTRLIIDFYRYRFSLTGQTAYKMAVDAEIYTFLKARAKERGITTDAELPGFTPAPDIYK